MTNQNYWNWQQKDWPKFTYNPGKIAAMEQSFLQQSGLSFGISKHISSAEKNHLIISLISNEALKTSEIEGEILDRDSLQSSIKKHFGFKAPLTLDKSVGSRFLAQTIDSTALQKNPT